MKINFKNKHFLSLRDFTKEEILYLIELAIKLKEEKKKGKYPERLKHKNIALLFEKNSTRTRCASIVACFDEGAHAEFLSKDDLQLGKKESVKDTARVFGRIYDAIIFRGYKEETLKILAEYSGIPVINGLTDEEHPTQIIADLMTIKEHFNKLKGLKLAFLGDGQNNVANSLIIGCLKMGMDVAIAAPKDLWPKEQLLDYVKNIKKESELIITENLQVAVKNADIIYTDVWLSMGEENADYAKKKVNMLIKYKVDSNVMKMTGKEDTIFMHCLPASHEQEVHNMEVTEDVFESKNSLVFQQAENRVHTIKAILIALLGAK